MILETIGGALHKAALLHEGLHIVQRRTFLEIEALDQREQRLGLRRVRSDSSLWPVDIDCGWPSGPPSDSTTVEGTAADDSGGATPLSQDSDPDSEDAFACGPPGVWRRPETRSDWVKRPKASVGTGTPEPCVPSSRARGRDSGRSSDTTAMLRELPKELTRTMLLGLLDGEGFRGMYDFVCLPRGLQSLVGLGYGFVNFVTHELAVAAIEHFQGFDGWPAGLSADKPCETVWSAQDQGLEAQVNRCRNCPVMHPDVPEELKPVLLSNGVPVPFPAPTKPLRAPVRMRMKKLPDAAPAAAAISNLQYD